MKHRRSIIVLSVFCVFFAAVFVFLSIWWFARRHPEFEQNASFGVKIPGLADGISPQGLCTLPEETHFGFAMSGYIEGKPSRVYLIADDPVADLKSAERYVTFTLDGEPVKSHFGGIACAGNYVYIASEEEILVARLGDLIAADHADAVELAGSLKTGFSENATCCVYDGMLVVAEFYHAGNYETEPSHHLQGAEGLRHTLAYAYRLDDAAEYGIADMGVPSYVLSLPDEVQGMAMTKEHIFLSASYGLPDSRLLVFENVFEGSTDKTFSVGGREIPLLYVENPQKCLAMPCMSEEICLRDGNLVVLFESQSIKYRYLVRNRIGRLVGIRTESLLPQGE